MKIKYHDTTIYPEYGADHKLLDNWDPNGAYGDNEYVKVHFNINCPAYRSGSYFMQFDNRDEQKAFYNEAAEALIALGWSVNEIEPGAYGTDCKKGKAHLYVHPDSLSGSVLKNDVRSIAEALSNRETFSMRWVNLHDTVYDYTDIEYKSYLETRADDIKAYILKHAKTTRRQFFVRSGDIVMNAGLSVRRKRIEKTDSGIIEGDRMETEVVSAIIEELINTGYLVKFERDNELYIRTINKTEQRQKKLYIEEVAA